MFSQSNFVLVSTSNFQNGYSLSNVLSVGSEFKSSPSPAMTASLALTFDLFFGSLEVGLFPIIVTLNR